MKRARAALAGLLAVLLAAAGTAACLAWSPAGDFAALNQDRNAVWLEHRWLEREHSRAAG